MFAPKTKIESACSTDKGREGITQPWVADDFLLATNGRILARLPVEMEDGDMPGPIPMDAIKAAKALCKKSTMFRLDMRGGSVALDNGASYPTPDVRLPDWQAVWPKITDRTGEKIVLAIDAGLLKNLADAMGSPCLKLEIWHQNGDVSDPIVATPDGDCACLEASGIIMPRRI